MIEKITNPRKLGRPRNKVEGKSVKESRETIEREFLKNNMSVLFSVNGQVHGHYTLEFITRSLKMLLLKSHLLIHVDCTHMRMSFRNELFMASRDTGEQQTGLSDLLNVRKASPSDGTIRIVLNPTKKAKVDDLIQILGPSWTGRAWNTSNAFG